MTLYTEKLIRGQFSNISFYTGIEAFYNMGFEIIEVESFNNLNIVQDNIFLGSIDFIHSALRKLNIPIPEPNDYPISLKNFIGRNISESTIEKISNNPDLWNVFVKPKGTLKKFAGRLVKTTHDLVGCGDRENIVPIWVSDPVDFISEWRVFVRYNKIIGVKSYKGDWRSQYDYRIIEDAVRSYENAPAGYAIDFGLTSDGKLLIVEVNEGYSIGSYGLFYVDYAKLISARWAELTGQIDLCDF